MSVSTYYAAFAALKLNTSVYKTGANADRRISNVDRRVSNADRRVSNADRRVSNAKYWRFRQLKREYGRLVICDGDSYGVNHVLHSGSVI